MNFRQNIPDNASGGIPLAPMIDVVFLLLIFFIVTWSLARFETELDVSVPVAKEGKESRRTVGEIIVNVQRDGTIVINQQKLTEEQVQSKLARIAQAYPDQAVILRGDENADYSAIIRVLDICQAVGIWNVAFATAKAEDRAPPPSP